MFKAVKSNFLIKNSHGCVERGHICGPSANWFDEALPMMGPYLSYVATTDVTGSAGETVRPLGSIGAAASHRREPQHSVLLTRFSRFASFSERVNSSLRSAWTPS